MYETPNLFTTVGRHWSFDDDLQCRGRELYANSTLEFLPDTRCRGGAIGDAATARADISLHGRGAGEHGVWMV